MEEYQFNFKMFRRITQDSWKLIKQDHPTGLVHTSGSNEIIRGYVKKACKENGVPYKFYLNFYKAMCNIK